MEQQNNNYFVVDGGTERLSRDIEDYPGGIVVPIDKPYRWTSADVIRKVKFAAIRHFGKRNLKVGHAGTLDPLATGILIVCIGSATKLAQTLQDHDKEYVAGISFGATTPSYDLEKDIDREFPCAHITAELIRSHLGGFIGEQEQVAPLFSAKSVDGVRAYELARKLYKRRQRAIASKNPTVAAQTTQVGDSADLTDSVLDDAIFDEKAGDLIRTAKIRITEAELLSFYPAGNSVIADRTTGTAAGASGRINVADTSALRLPRADIRIVCSKGTYIRAFARDFGEALGSGAHLDALRRTKNGPFDISRAVSLERIISLLGSF